MAAERSFDAEMHDVCRGGKSGISAFFARVELIPVPRAISSACGFCLFFSKADQAADAAGRTPAGARDIPGSAAAPSGKDALRALLAFARLTEAEAAYRVVETEIKGRKRKEKSYERIEIG